MSFTFWCHFTNQNVAAFHFCTDVHDARFVKLRQSRFTHVRDVSRDLFCAQLSITRHTRKLLDVDSGKAVILNYALRH
ncbi:Uncharacterised protein [Vibrio cholerae]|nr:Uncharacterised protein [Vibrio cholerae]